jgi:hypothetical protein
VPQDAASNIISAVINGRLQRLLREIGTEEQNGFMGGRGCSDGIFCIRQGQDSLDLDRRL